jgi:carbonic anhydrase/acetyltransferase-like protein (isoleucine patch superfamily)
MNNRRTISISPVASILEAMKLLKTTGLQFINVISSDGKLLGSVTNGDIRRGILRNIALQDTIAKVMNSTPLTLHQGVTISGGVTVGDCSHIGTGATIVQGIAVGRNCTIGSGAVVIRDVLDGTTVVGVPARARSV